MSSYKLFRVTPIAEGSNNIDNWGYVGRMARKRIEFVDTDTGRLFVTTDLEIKKYGRNKRLTLLYNSYALYIHNKKVSTLLCVIDIVSIPDISSFLKTQKRRFKRMGLSLLAYYWQRDIGDIKFEPHFHLILIFDRNNNLKLLDIFQSNMWEMKVKSELCLSLYRFQIYLREKEIYAPLNKRSYGISKSLLLPK